MEIRPQSGSWYDVLSFLSLAAALGLVSGVAFGAVALLLAGPAYGADSGEIKEGTLMLRRRERPADAAREEPVQAPLVSTDVLFQVTGPIARARVIQTFHNPQEDWYEGVYIFPLPENAAGDGLRVRVGG